MAIPSSGGYHETGNFNSRRSGSILSIAGSRGDGGRGGIWSRLPFHLMFYDATSLLCLQTLREPSRNLKTPCHGRGMAWMVTPGELPLESA